MAGRTTNQELGERLAAIEGQLNHMATREQLAELRQDVRAIERALPTYEQAANRTDITQGRELERGESGRETRTLWSLIISGFAVFIAVITAWWESVK